MITAQSLRITCFITGSIFLSLGIWEILLAPINTKGLNQVNTSAFLFIVISYFFNICVGSLKLLISANIFDTNEIVRQLNESDIPSLDYHRMGLGLWCTIMYFMDLPIRSSFKEILLAETCVFFTNIVLLTLAIKTKTNSVNLSSNAKLVYATSLLEKTLKQKEDLESQITNLRSEIRDDESIDPDL